MSAPKLSALGWRYYCSGHALGETHDFGDRKPERKKCRYCGCALITVQGRWGVFTSSQTSAYHLDEALKTYRSREMAERYARELNNERAGLIRGRRLDGGGYVVRWILAEGSS